MAVQVKNVAELLRYGIQEFRNEFKCEPQNIGISPGRTNLIGEHTDYNEGFVFPLGIPMYTAIIGRRNENAERICRLKTLNIGVDTPHYVEFKCPAGESKLERGQPNWANYVKGVLQYFQGSKCSFDAVIISSLPFGAGLSSSAALEVSCYSFLESITGNVSDPLEKAKICQKAEHNYGNVPCGLMDQLICIWASDGYGCVIDCRSNTVEKVPLENKDVAFMIINSMVKHELSASEYPIRKATCESVAKKLKKNSLRDVTMKEIDDLKAKNIINDVEYKRAHHVLTENERVLDAKKELLKSGNFKKFGELMSQSHVSLKNDYEVSCVELDQLVEITQGVKGVYGSRMTGGGFGGAIITLVERASIDHVIEAVKKNYTKNAQIYVVKPVEGCKSFSIEEAKKFYTL